MEKDFALLLKVYGRTTASTKIDDKNAKEHRSTPWGGNGVGANTDNELAYNALKTDSWSTIGEISDVGDAVNNVEELVLSGKYKMEDFLCNKNWLDAVIQKGHTLIKQGEDNSDDNAHGKLAKDQPGEGPRYDTAIACSKRADELVFAPIRAVMNEKDEKAALAATQKQLALIDQMVAAPAPGHPLWDLLPDT
jgi:hypothetical protein